MSVFWIIRLVLIAVLGAMVVAGSYLLRSRKQYQQLLNNWFFNILFVLNYQLFSYLIVILPSAECKVPILCRIEYQRTQIPYVLVGVCLFVPGFSCRLSQRCREKLLAHRISHKNS